MTEVDWQGFKDSILAVVRTMVSDVESANVFWSREAQPAFGPSEAQIKLEIIGRRRYGEDELLGVDAGGNVLSLNVKGLRGVTLSVQAECLSHDGARFAFNWLSQVIDRLSWQSVRETFREAHISIYTVAPIALLPNFTVDEREYSAANFSMVLGYVHEEVDAGYDGSWIQTVGIDSPFLPEDQNPIVVPE